LLVRSQPIRSGLGVATLASSFHDEGFIRQEVEQMYGWLSACTLRAPDGEGGRVGKDAGLRAKRKSVDRKPRR